MNDKYQYDELFFVNKRYSRVSDTLLTQHAESTRNHREYYFDRLKSKSRQISSSYQRTFLDAIQGTEHERCLDVLCLT